MRPTAPISSAITPMLLTREMIRTPSRFTVVVSRIMIAPRMKAFFANAGSKMPGSSCRCRSSRAAVDTSHLMNWNFGVIWGRITCHASATAGIVTICAQR